MIIRRIRTDHDGKEIPGHAVLRNEGVNLLSTENGLILVERAETHQSVCIARPQSTEVKDDGMYLDVMVEIEKMPGCYQREAWVVTE